MIPINSIICHRDAVIGSPPHTRGTEYVVHFQCIRHRITPAYAGNSTRRTSPPHTRGTGMLARLVLSWAGITPAYAGNSYQTHLIASQSSGSPPHTRGTGPDVIEGGAPSGITPAYAGNSHLSSRASACTQDHPRIRGEQRILKPLERLRSGSPPHTRGTGN